MWPKFCILNLFRLGKDCESEYGSYVIQKKEKYKTVSEKADEAVELTQQNIRLAFDIMTKIFNLSNTNRLNKFLSELHFINNLCKCFAQHCPGTDYPANIINNRQVYYPKLVDSYQHDCRALLHDLMSFGHRVEPYLSDCQKVCELHIYIRFAKTVKCFLGLVKRNNPEFFSRLPSYVRQALLSEISRLLPA